MGALVRGGIHDHVGGGFARYSVDEAWHVPHFEKMLYDNAQMVSALAAWADEAHPEFIVALTQAVAFMERDWRLDHGGFCAALDADSRPQLSYSPETGEISIELADGSRQLTTPLQLRRLCRSPANRPDELPDDLSPLDIVPMGNYAVSVRWSDGHQSLLPYRSFVAGFT